MERWIDGLEIKPKKSFTKSELIKLLSQLKNKGWIQLRKHRAGRDGGFGNTLEDLLGIPENNIPLADYGDLELKTHRSSNSLISLFRFEPSPRDRNNAIIPYLIKNYGWPLPKYGPKEMSLRVDIDGAGYCERGFKSHSRRIISISQID